MTSSAKPDFAAMNGAELLKAFNAYSGKSRASKFPNSAAGIAACEKAYAAALEAGTADKPTRPAKAKEKTKAAKAPKAAKAAKAAKAKAAAGRARRSLDDRIVILAPQNPRREGTFAYAHLQKMQKSKTVGDYLAKFDEGDARRTASQWLWNTVRDGHVKVEPAE